MVDLASPQAILGLRVPNCDGVRVDSETPADNEVSAPPTADCEKSAHDVATSSRGHQMQSPIRIKRFIATPLALALGFCSAVALAQTSAPASPANAKSSAPTNNAQAKSTQPALLPIDQQFVTTAAEAGA